MAWSAENATKAFLSTIRTGNNYLSEPGVAEFISALAAGSGARVMIDVCSSCAGPITVALAAAARQTGGRVICNLPSFKTLDASEKFLQQKANNVELIVGDPESLLLGETYNADFVIVDCDMKGHDRVFMAAKASTMEGVGGMVVGYNAFHSNDSWISGRSMNLLPIGEGLRVCHVASAVKKSRWVAMVDECTGEEDVFRLRSSPRINL